MYTTKSLSVCLTSANTLREQPTSPLSGSLVFTDEQLISQETSCLNTFNCTKIKTLPFPQDKILSIVHPSKCETPASIKVLFIPVLDQPLSSNQYYIIKTDGEQKGEAFKCTREMDESQSEKCFFGTVTKEINSYPFDYRDEYQRIEIHHDLHSGGFMAKSVAPDGSSPHFLRVKGWEVYDTSPNQSQLGEARGLDASLGCTLPEFTFLLPNSRSTPIVVGKWYCPFMFVKEEIEPKKEMKGSLFYTMKLEQWWEEIHSSEASRCGNIVTVSTSIKREVATVCGMETMRDESDDRYSDDGFIWFRVDEVKKKQGVLGVGLSEAIYEKMISVLVGGGWVDGGEREVRVERIEENRSERGWKKFGCYVLVESFVLRRMDGSLLLKCDYKHSNRIECIWE